MITKEDLFNGTNKGLDILFYFYPQAREVHGQANNKFRARSSDKTPSAVLKEFNGIWKVIDFGDDGKALNGIDVCMREKDMKFPEAIHFLGSEFNISGTGISPEINKPVVDVRNATEDENEGDFKFEEKETFTPAELAVLGPKVTQKVCEELGYKSVAWIRTTRKQKTRTTYSNENYPIFVRTCRYLDAGSRKAHFYKIYQPLNPEKQYRFFYSGEKPQQYVNGQIELDEAYITYNDDLERAFKGKKGNEDKDYIRKKLDHAIICSGERDALCVMALGYRPLWFNSESYNLSEGEYGKMFRCAEKIYNIPDLDETGINRGMKLAFKFIDIYTIWLPAKLKTFRDRRGNPRKDFRDFCEIWPEKNRFRGLLNMAKPLQFWKYEENSKGQRRLDLVTEYMIYFLRSSGFAMMEDKLAKTGYMFVHLDGNIVKEVKLKQMKAALKQFVHDREQPIEIRELVNNSTRVTESNLDLEEITLNFEDYTPSSQTFFFPNVIWEVKEDKIIEHKPGTMSQFVWNEEVINHNVKRLAPTFTIKLKDDTKYMDADNWTIDINPEQNSNFLKFLCNASRIFWRREFDRDDVSPEDLKEYSEKHKFAIDGPWLNESEIDEQKLHLINKIFCLGYLLHRYKAEDKPWCVWAMDGKLSDVGQSNGGSGKSFFMKAPMLFMKSEDLPGRDPKMTENKHILENITEHTDYVLVDDAHDYFDFPFFYEKITGTLTINPKFNKSFTIAYQKSPKWGFTTNYTQRKLDSSTSRRMLYTVFSDWYHHKHESNDYKESRTIKDDFGKQLFREEYTTEEWNADINFFIDCCQFYLSVVNKGVKVDPPMDNVVARNRLTIMGSKFLSWAEVYFSPEAGNCDKAVSNEEAKLDFEKTESVKGWSTQRFTDALAAYCQHKFPEIIALNPEDQWTNPDGRIIKKTLLNGISKTRQCFYVKRAKYPDYVSKDNTNNTEENGNTETNPAEDPGLPF